MLQYYTVHMHAMYSQTQNNTYTKMNLRSVKWTQWDKTQSRELLGLLICVYSSLCTIVAHNTAQNRPDNFPSRPPDNHHCSDDVYLRERGDTVWIHNTLWEKEQCSAVLCSSSVMSGHSICDSRRTVSGEGRQCPALLPSHWWHTSLFTTAWWPCCL